MTKKLLNKKGFTLVEMLVAVSLFAVVSLIGTMIFINVSRVHRQVNLQNAVYEDARFMMERIVSELRTNAVDYEEYYNQMVLEGEYGENYGEYATLFYDLGSDGNRGVVCAPATDVLPDCIINRTTIDTNTGETPVTTPLSDPNDATAFYEVPITTEDEQAKHEAPELYLIDSTGNEKTILARERISEEDDFALSIVKMKGTDENNDGIMGTFYCDTEQGFICDGTGNVPDKNDLTTLFDPYLDNDFIPISPKRSHVESLKFYIAPLEDPRKAFAELDSTVIDKVQIHPYITIVLTVRPSTSEVVGLAEDDIPKTTIQTTVSTRVYQEVKSYPPDSYLPF